MQDSTPQLKPKSDRTATPLVRLQAKQCTPILTPQTNHGEMGVVLITEYTGRGVGHASFELYPLTLQQSKNNVQHAVKQRRQAR